MAFVSLARGRPAPAVRRTTSRPVLLAAAVAVAAVAAMALAGDPARLAGTLGDTDDAVRLIEVRRLLAGAAWGDMTLPSIGAPEPLLSHWSRLIDVPLAALIKLSTPFAGAAAAELVARAVWPLLLLLTLCLVLARAAAAAVPAHPGPADDSGPAGAAALIAVILAATSISGVHQFLPGRIDHHNAMILLAVAGLLALGRSFVAPRLGAPAGVLLGLALAVGYEPLALIVAGLGLHGLAVLVTRRGEHALLAAAVALAATLAVALLATTAPQHLLSPHCDALSLNLVLLAGCCAGGAWLVIAGPLSAAAPWARFGGLAAAAGAGLAAYGAAGPQCLAGPFGGLDPSIHRLLLGEVMETQPWPWQLAHAPLPAVAFAVTALAGLAAAWHLWRRDRDIGRLASFAILAAAVALGLWQIKLIPYATFLAVVPTAAAIATAGPLRGLSAATVSAMAALAVSQPLAAAWALPLVALVRPADTEQARLLALAQKCLATPSVRPLAALPPGLVLAERDLGPYIAALTPHRVVAAPYHRLDKALMAHDAIMSGPPADAEARLRSLGVAYVAICPDLMPHSAAAIAAATAGPAGAVERQGLYAALLARRVPEYLVPVAVAGETPLRVWRVRPASEHH